jgi:hypothetical protein
VSAQNFFPDANCFDKLLKVVVIIELLINCRTMAVVELLVFLQLMVPKIDDSVPVLNK